MKYAAIRKLLRATPANREIIKVTLQEKDVAFLLQTFQVLRKNDRLTGINPVYLISGISVIYARSFYSLPYEKADCLAYEMTPNELHTFRQVLLHYQAYMGEFMDTEYTPVLNHAVRSAEAARKLAKRLHPSFLNLSDPS